MGATDRGAAMLQMSSARAGRTSGRPARISLVVALVALLLPTVLSSSRAADAATGANPVVNENQLPGTAAWQLGKPGDDIRKQIKGYASAASVNLGETVNFFVTVNPAQTYTIDIYRIGYYQGLGGRLVQHVGALAGVVQPACPTDATTGMISCNWSLGYQLTVPTTWTSGVFLVKLTNAQGFQNYITFT